MAMYVQSLKSKMNDKFTSLFQKEYTEILGAQLKNIAKVQFIHRLLGLTVRIFNIIFELGLYN